MHKRDDSRREPPPSRAVLKVLGGALALSLSLVVVVSLVGGEREPARPIRHQSHRRAFESPVSPGDSSARVDRRAPASANPTSIAISRALPDAAGLSPRLRQKWNNALESLGTAAGRAAAKSAVVGIPGTRATTNAEARELQAHLDCTAGEGEWVYDSNGHDRERSGSAGLTVHKHASPLAACDRQFYKASPASDGSSWHVRESLKWRWVASPSCVTPGRPSPPLSRRALCTRLAHKSTLLVGDALQYSLHDLILDWTSTEPQSCYGDLYCKEHALCGDILRATNSAAAAAALERWAPDERVFHRLPSSPSSPSAPIRDSRAVPDLSPALDSDPADAAGKPKSVSYGTMLRYRRSDGLQYSSVHTTPTFAHPSTGVREVNQQWLADARRADVVVLTKPPLPLPLRGHNATWDTWWDASEARPDERIIEAAWRVTEDVWLPELLDSLRAVRAGRAAATDQLIVYRGGWRAHPDCGTSSSPVDDDAAFAAFVEWTSPGDGPPPHPMQPTLRELLFRSASSTALRDPHALFSALQTVLQNHAVRTQLAPAFGVAFLDLESSLSVWRSGMLGGSAASPFQAGLVDQSSGGVGKGLRSAASGDCHRYCVPSPGMAIEEAFLGGLIRVLDRGE